MPHIDAWTGEEIPGKAIILNTTEGPELIDPGHLQGGPEHDQDQDAAIRALRDRVTTLEGLVQQLVDGQTPEQPAATEAKATTAKAAAK